MHEKSKYCFTEFEDGFLVEAPQRVPVRVTLCPTGFRVEVNEPRQLLLFPELEDDRKPPLAATLLQYQRLVYAVAEAVMSKWTSPVSREPRFAVEKWAREKTRHALGGRIHQQWRRLTAKADPVIWGVQKAVFAAAPFEAFRLAHAPGLYQDRNLTADILRYRSAASVVTIAYDLCCFHDDLSRQAQAAPHQESEANGDNEEGDFGYLHEYLLAKLSDWQGLCSPTGVRYRSLSRTLMQLPGGISLNMLSALPTVRLIRPMTDRLELATLLSAAYVESEHVDEECSSRLRIFHHAQRTEIRDAIELVSGDVPSPLSHRRSADISTFVRFLYDFPDEHRGGLRTLARKAVRWHRSTGRRRRALADLRGRIREETSTKHPPIPLPEIEGVRFLSTVGDILDEGKQMGHCIGYYAERAVIGECFLFHVEHRGECASVEVGRTGSVLQACGPWNQANVAAQYGGLVLGRWGARIKSDAEPDIDNAAYIGDVPYHDYYYHDEVCA